VATKVLFVCLGNICRSPTAHGVMETKVQQQRLDGRISVDSAGTSDWHIGRAPDSRSIACARTSGYELGEQRARQVSSDDFNEFDYILAMDKNNLAELHKIAPEDFSGHLGLFLDVLPDQPLREMPDPYHSDADGFRLVLSLAEEACDAWIERILAPQARA
jgi:protein-tyrosine phosphatase